MNKNELIARLKIDKLDLDTELIEQPSLFNEVSEGCVDAIDTRDYLKEQLSIVEAREAREIRADFDRDKTKYVATQVAQAVSESEDYINALNEYLDAKKDCNSWQALKDSFEQRSRMLGHLCRLYMSDYYSNPNASDSKVSSDTKHKVARKVIGDARRQKYNRRD